MRTLSIRQPWAWLIVRPDITDPQDRAKALLNGEIKDIENRDWETLFRGPVLIHAGKTMAKVYHREVSAAVLDQFGIHIPTFDELPRGGIVGVATIAGCVRESASPWFDNNGGFGFVMRDARPLPFYACNGMLKFFDVPAGAVGLPT